MNRLAVIKKICKLRLGIFLLFCSELALSAWAPASTSQFQLSSKVLSVQRQLVQGEPGAPAPKNISDLKGYNELLPFVSPSPDQEEAGTCLFMSLTGIAEWFLNRQKGVHFKQNGDTDLSERWWVNMNSRLSSQDKLSSWTTDTIYLFNRFSGVLNSSYPYTKGWFYFINGVITKAFDQQLGAAFGTTYNWIDETANSSLTSVKLPTFQRIILHQDSSKDPWSFGEGRFQLVEKVKQSLQTYKAPVQVIYNHLGYWHSVFIVGFDDQLPTYNCYFIRETREFYKKEILKFHSQWQIAVDLEVKKELLSKIELLKSNSQKFEQVHKRNGGCRQRGMFYVRDSQYVDPSEEVYHYDLIHHEYSKPYAKRIILREYNWLSDLSSHVMQISVPTLK